MSRQIQSTMSTKFVRGRSHAKEPSRSSQILDDSKVSYPGTLFVVCSAWKSLEIGAVKSGGFRGRVWQQLQNQQWKVFPPTSRYQHLRSCQRIRRVCRIGKRLGFPSTLTTTSMLMLHGQLNEAQRMTSSCHRCRQILRAERGFYMRSLRERFLQ